MVSAKKLVIFLWLIPSLVFCTAEVRQVKHFCTAQELIKIFHEKNRADNATRLFVFDIDGVIEQQCLLREVVDQCIDCSIDDDTMSLLDSEHYGSCAMRDSDLKPVPVDKAIHDYIKELQKQGYKVICLTNTIIGPYGDKIPSTEDFRIERLKSNFGLDFSHAFETLKSCIYVLDKKDVFQYAYKNASLHEVMLKEFTDEKGVVFKDGILFANGVDKGKVLENFLVTVKGLGYTPSSVVFIDDQLRNINCMHTMAEKESIPFLLIHYDQAARLKREFEARVADWTEDKLCKEAEAKLKQYAEQLVPPQPITQEGMTPKPRSLVCSCFIFEIRLQNGNNSLTRKAVAIYG
jgi:Protein of unknown function (DUF2608).